MVSYAKASSYTLLLLVSGASAVQSGLRQVDNKHDTIADACAAANLPEYSKVAKLCEDLGVGGLDMGMDDSVFLGTKAVGKLLSEPTRFNMREILEAEDAEAAYNKIEAQTMKQTERKLFVDYGWCSSNIGFVTGISDDSSNYCDTSQQCDSFDGCGSELSDCCITHDQCLNAEGEQGSVSNSRCSPVDCKGATCDANLSSCAWNVSCCSFSFFGPSCDSACLAASTAISGTFGLGETLSPQSGWNTDGDDADAVCSASG